MSRAASGAGPVPLSKRSLPLRGTVFLTAVIYHNAKQAEKVAREMKNAGKIKKRHDLVVPLFGSGRRIRICGDVFFLVKCRIIQFGKPLKIQGFPRLWYNHAQPCKIVFGVFVGVKIGVWLFPTNAISEHGRRGDSSPIPLSRIYSHT